MNRFLSGLRRRLRASEDDKRGFSVWGDRARERQNQDRAILAWTDSPLVLRLYIHPAISGEPDRNWLDWSKRFFTEPVPRALNIGCGDGGLDRHALACGLAAHLESFDASAGAIDLARELARTHHVADRIDYVVADLNTHTFQPAAYDAAFASMAVHHIRELEHFFSQVRRSLKPGGLFFMNEFVGPNQFQWTAQQMRLADDLLNTIPERYRRSLLSGHIKVRNVRQTLEHMNTVDPTEAVRSADILPVLQSDFELVEKRDYGGTLLNLVLEEIAGNFQDTPEDIAVLTSLFEVEREYLKRGILSSDFTVVVAKSRG